MPTHYFRVDTYDKDEDTGLWVVVKATGLHEALAYVESELKSPTSCLFLGCEVINNPEPTHQSWSRCRVATKQDMDDFGWEDYDPQYLA